jgi:hypothetical protein
MAMSLEANRSLNAPESNQMNHDHLSSPARNFRLEAEFLEHYITKHPHGSSETRWKHKKWLGSGYNGEVSLEECVEECNGIPKMRAVKKIPNTKSENIPRELEAIAIFSKPEVRKSTEQATSEANIICLTVSPALRRSVWMV